MNDGLIKYQDLHMHAADPLSGRMEFSMRSPITADWYKFSEYNEHIRARTPSPEAEDFLDFYAECNVLLDISREVPSPLKALVPLSATEFRLFGCSQVWEGYNPPNQSPTSTPITPGTWRIYERNH